MKKLVVLFSLLITSLTIAQSTWKKIDLKNFSARGTNQEVIKKERLPKKYELYTLDVDTFKRQLNVQGRNVKKTIELPNTLGKIEYFEVYETSYLQPELAKKFPNIKSYSLKGINDSYATGKISIGNDGVHVMISSPNHSTFYIDPHSKDRKTYISYERKNLERHDLKCEVHQEKEISKRLEEPVLSAKSGNDGLFRTYRLAMGCTIEYAKFHLENQNIPTTATETTKKAAVLSAINTTVTRVNQIYERDFSVNFILVNDNDKIINIYTDNLSDSDSSALTQESQTMIDNLIGDANYDLGHTVSTGGGGLAMSGLCKSGIKARGITGSSRPINDAYDVDYVSHEMGHQLGAMHTFAANAGGSCQGNRVEESGMEPGSGSTIMGYAGICDYQNIQNNSDDYFHAISIKEIWDKILSTDCATLRNITNTPPKVNAGNDYTIPALTPFVLKGTATDNDNDNLTYCWEQIDTGYATQPPVETNKVGPLFRSLPPSNSPKRFLPEINTVLAGETQTPTEYPSMFGGSTDVKYWEVLPSIARELNFALTVRDNHKGGGATGTDKMKINVIETAPFIVTSQNNAVTWIVGTTQHITWNKSTTDIAPINCKTVNIKLSTDGGKTFPIILAENAANIGSHNILVPNNLTSTARIKVEAADNIFYNINRSNFTIKNDNSILKLAVNNANQEKCETDTNDIAYTINVTTPVNFSDTITFSADNLPQGTTANFSPATLNSSGKTTLTISNSQKLTAQVNTISIIANTSKTTADLNIITSSIGTTSAIYPVNGATAIGITPNLTWEGLEAATSYIIELAKDNSFNPIIERKEISNNYFNPTQLLESNTTYYWRIKAKGTCAEGNFSNTYNFTTENATYCTYFSGTQYLNDNYITYVGFGEIDNNSGNGPDNNNRSAYDDFTNQTATVNRGETYTIKIKTELQNAQSRCFVYFDWNQDKNFSDEEYQQIYEWEYSGSTSNEFPITIPKDARLGQTRMRVIVDLTGNNIAAINPCYTKTGEVEDYTINIIGETTNPSFDFNLNANNINLTKCSNSTDTVSYILNTNVISGSETITFSANNLPNGVTASFSPTTLSTSGTTTMTLNGISNFNIGQNSISIVGKSDSTTKTTSINLTLIDATIGVSTLDSPVNKSVDNSTTPSLTWSALNNATSYTVQIATDSSFNTIVETIQTKTNNATTKTLNEDTTYYWRVKGTNDCGESDYSSAFSFSTISQNTTFAFNLTPVVTSKNSCNNQASASYTINTEVLQGSELITFNTENLPTGVTASFNPATLNTSGTTTMTLSGISKFNIGQNTITIVGKSNSATKTTSVNLTLIDATIGVSTLDSPVNTSVDNSTTPSLTWSALNNVTNYTVQIATDSNFNTIIETIQTKTNNTTTKTLNEDTTYYWRVKGTNDCEDGKYSSTFSFSTISQNTTFAFNLTPEITSENSCNNQASISYTINTEILQGSEVITFSTENLPNGVTSSFNPATLNASGITTMTLSGISSFNIGENTITVIGKSNSTTKITSVNLTLTDANIGISTLDSPVNTSVDNSTTPSLTWSALNNVTNYTVQIATDSSFNTIVETIQTKTNNATTKTLNEDTTYYWRVKGINNCGEGDYSSTFSFSTISPDTIFAFNLTPEIKKQESCNDKEAISYTFNTEVLQGSEVITFSTETLPTGVIASFSPATLNASGTTTMTLSGVSKFNIGENTITVIGKSDNAIKKTSINLTLTDANIGISTLDSPTNTSVDNSTTPLLTWSTLNNVTNYTVQIATDSSFNTIVETIQTETNSTTTKNLNEDTTYYWRVKGTNNCGKGNYSATFSFSTISQNTVFAFSLTPENKNQESCNNKETISYTFNTEVIKGSEVITFSTKSLPSGVTASFSPKTLDTSGATTLTLNGISNFNIGQNTISVVGKSNSTSKTTTIDLTLADATIDASNLETLSSPSTTPTLSWSALDNTSTYTIEVATDNEFSNIVQTNSITSNSFTFNESLEEETTYYWRVKGINSCGEGAYSATSSFTTTNNTTDNGGSNNNPEKDEPIVFTNIKNYPNPAPNGVVNVSFDSNNSNNNNNEVIINLYDMRGRLVDHIEYNNSSANFSETIQFNYPSTETYLLQIISNGKIVTSKKVIFK